MIHSAISLQGLNLAVSPISCRAPTCQQCQPCQAHGLLVLICQSTESLQLMPSPNPC